MNKILEFARRAEIATQGEFSVAELNLEIFADLIRKDERERCCAIVFGQCGSDNVAQRTVDAIRKRP